MLDGVYRRTGGEPSFQETRAPTRDELEGLLDKIVARLMKMLTRQGICSKCVFRAIVTEDSDRT